jgi:hypothetical protein
MTSWNLDSIPWQEFDRGKVDMDLLVLAKTASVVEYNSADYVTYLHNVFHDDPQIQKEISRWGEEEKNHGLALARWATLVDPTFDFEKSLARFSTRGNRSAARAAPSWWRVAWWNAGRAVIIPASPTAPRSPSSGAFVN